MQLTQQATPEDIIKAAADLTREDLLEFHAAAPKDNPECHLMEYLQKARKEPTNYTMRVLKAPDGYPLLVGGWSIGGVVWFITTNAAKLYPLQVMKALKECKEEALQAYSRLWNVVMLTNTQHVKLLKGIGAEFIGPIHSIGSEPFQAFTIEKEV